MATTLDNVNTIKLSQNGLTAEQWRLIKLATESRGQFLKVTGSGLALTHFRLAGDRQKPPFSNYSLSIKSWIPAALHGVDGVVETGVGWP